MERKENEGIDLTELTAMLEKTTGKKITISIGEEKKSEPWKVTNVFRGIAASIGDAVGGKIDKLAHRGEERYHRKQLEKEAKKDK